MSLPHNKSKVTEAIFTKFDTREDLTQPCMVVIMTQKVKGHWSQVWCETGINYFALNEGSG